MKNIYKLYCQVPVVSREELDYESKNKAKKESSKNELQEKLEYWEKKNKLINLE